MHDEPTTETLRVRGIDMKLDVAVIPVGDVDRAKRFYEQLGWRLDADFLRSDGSRAVQLTPPGSPSSIHWGTSRFFFLSSPTSRPRAPSLPRTASMLAKCSIVARNIRTARQD